MQQTIKKQNFSSSPNLNTILMVENFLKHSDGFISIPEIKRNLPKQVNHNTLKTILHYLEESNKIFVSMRGISWIPEATPKLKSIISKSKSFPEDFS